MNKEKHEKAIEEILKLDEIVQDYDIEDMNKTKVETILTKCDVVYNLIKEDIGEIAEINKYRDATNTTGDPVVRIDYLLDVYARANKTKGNFYCPEVEDGREANITAWHHKGWDYIKKATVILKEFDELFPNEVDVLYDLGTLLCRVANFEEGIKYLKQANQIEPAADIQQNLKYAQKRLDEKNYQKDRMPKHIPMEYKGWC